VATTVADADVIIHADVSKLASELRKKIEPIVASIKATIDTVADTSTMRDQVKLAVASLQATEKAVIKAEVVVDDSAINGLQTSLSASRERFAVAGEDSGRALGDGIGRGLFTSTERVGRDASSNVANSLVPSLRSIGGDAGTQAGGAIGTSLTSSLSSSLSVVPSLISNPVVLGVGIALGVLASIPAGAAIAAGSLIGLGGGFLALGAFALKGNKDVAASFQNLKNTIGSTLTQAAEPLTKPLIQAFGIIGKAVKEIGPQLKEAFAALAPTIVPLAEGLAGFIKALTPGLTDALIAAGPLLDEIAKELPELGKAFGFLFKALSFSGKDSVSIISIAFDVLKGILIGVGLALLGLSFIFGVAADAARPFLDTAGELIDFITNLDFDGASQSIIRFVTGALGAIKNGFDQAIVILSQLADQFALFISNTVNAGFNILSAGFNAMLDIVFAFPGQVLSALSGLAGTVSGLMHSAFEAGTNAIRSGLRNAAGTVSGFIGQVKAIFSRLPDILFSSGASMIKSFVSGMLSQLRSVSRAASSIISAAKNVFPNSPPKEGPMAGSGYVDRSGAVLVEDFADGMLSKTKNLASASASIISVIQDAMTRRLSGVLGAMSQSPLPSFGEGGLITRPTVALVGERGPEMITPLNRTNSGSSINNSRTISPTINVNSNSSNPDMIAGTVLRRLVSVGAF